YGSTCVENEVFRFSPAARVAMLRRMVPLSNELVLQHVRAALAEDVGSGDVTTLATVPEDASVRAAMVAREEMIVSGLAFAEAAFIHALGPQGIVPQIRGKLNDGARVSPGTKLMEIEGSARTILTGERVALNFVQRLSGVATLA